MAAPEAELVLKWESSPVHPKGSFKSQETVRPLAFSPVHPKGSFKSQDTVRPLAFSVVCTTSVPAVQLHLFFTFDITLWFVPLRFQQFSCICSSLLIIMITYTVVEFEKEKTVAIVCRTWIVANGNVLSCYWPPSEPSKKAKNGELPDKKTWKLFKIRIIEKSFTSNYEKAVKYLRRAEELSNVETDGDTQIKKRAHKRPSRFESDTEDECVTPAKRPRFQCLAGNRPQAPVFTENRQEHEPLPQVTSALPYQNGCQGTNEEQNYLTLNRKIDEVIRELRQLREIIMQQQQQVVEEQAHVEQMQTEEELSAFCSKLNEERSFRKSMIAFSVRFCSGTVGQSVRRMMRAFGTNMLWSNFSLKGRKGKKVFQDLPIMRLITRACIQTFKAAKMAEIEGEVAECLKHAPHKRGGPKNLRIDVPRAEDDNETQIGQSPCLFDSDSD